MRWSNKGMKWKRGHKTMRPNRNYNVSDPFTFTLCSSCTHGTVMRSVNGKEGAQCGRVEAWVPPIEKCTDYKNKMEPDRYDLEKSAWLIDLGSHKDKAIGFRVVRPGSKEHNKILNDEM